MKTNKKHVSRGNTPIKASTSKEVKMMTNDELNAIMDAAVVSLFDATSASLDEASLPRVGKTFTLGKTSVSRGRRVVSSLAPQSYESNQDARAFHKWYALSQFFDRYISSEEMVDVLPKLQAQAARKFLDINHEGWSYDMYAFSDSRLKPLFTKMQYIIGQVLNDFDLLEIYEQCKHGPNSTSTVPFSDAYLDIKDGDWSGTPASLQQFIHFLNTYDTSLKECMMHHSDAFRSNINAWHIDGLDVVDSTTLSLVPKNFQSLRTMCPEPTIPAFHSQGVGADIAKKLHKVGIDLTTQPEVHQRLAKLGSLYPELNIATVDWSGASDRIWIALCESVMTEGKAPRYFDYIMNVCRTEFTKVVFKGCFGVSGDFDDLPSLRGYCLGLKPRAYTIETKASKSSRNKKIYYECCVEVRTSMIGTMGNAITFPLQTLLFYSFLTACNELASERLAFAYGPSTPDTYDFQYVSAFGDDGICDARAKDEIIYYADLLGWKINVDKSHFEGGFRESCGGDYYMGRNVRAVRMKRPPTNPTHSIGRNLKVCQAWLYIAANAVCETIEAFNGSYHLIDDWLVRLHNELSLGKVCVVPPNYPDGSGYRVTDLVGPTYYATSQELSFPEWGVSGVGYGLDPHLYHIPWFNTITTSFVFYALSSQPGIRSPLQEYSYYCRAIKGSERSSVPYWHTSFFDMDKKAMTRLDNEGNTKVKECRLHKVKSSVLDWNNGFEIEAL